LSKHENLCVLGLTLLAAILRLYHLDAYTLSGDEYNRIREAIDLGSNMNSLPYFLMLRLAMYLGTSEFILRMPAVLFGIATIPLMYRLGKELINPNAGIIAALLIATSSFAIKYAQQVNFYSLFLCSATLSFWCLFRYLRYGRGKWPLFLMVVTALLALASHLLGIFILIIQGIVYILSIRNPREQRRTVMILVTALFLILGLLAVPGVRQLGFSMVTKYTNARGGTLSTWRGLGVVNIAKIPLTFFQFAVGESVYPLDFYFTLPSIVLLGFLLLQGIWHARRNGQELVFYCTSLIGTPLFLYVVLDSLVPPYYQGAAPRYLIFLLIPFYLVMTRGLLAAKRSFPVVLFGVLVVQSLALLSYWSGNWNFDGRLTNWRYASRFVQEHTDANTVLLHDGRSADPIKYYFPSSVPSRNVRNYTGNNQTLGDLLAFDRLIFVSNDSQDGNRAVMNVFLQRLETQFVFQDGFVEYPLFVYVYLRNDTGGYHVDEATGIISIPKEIYGLPFSDLRLPQEARYAGLSIPLTGSFSLPSLDGSRDRTIPLRGNVSGEALVLLSNLTQARSLPLGEPVAEVIVYTGEGEPAHFVLRKGIETNDWSEGCGPEGSSPSMCEIAFSWHKRIAMVGRRAYEGAWRDFQAHIFGTTLALDAPVAPRAIGIHYLAGKGTLHVWGMAVVRK
jgi:hypothetical protein